MNVILRLCIALCVLYAAVLALLYFFQERLIFFPSKLEPNHEFSFDQPFEEIRLDSDGAWISGLKFLAQSRGGGQIYGDTRDVNGERKAKNGTVIFSTVTRAICKAGASMRGILRIWAMIFTCLTTEATARAAAR